MYIIKSENYSGLFDEKTNTAYVKNKSFKFPINNIFEPGDKIKLDGNSFIILRPDPFFFNEVSGRMTQTIIPSDIAYIIYSGAILPGKKILESGIGIGNLSYSILNFIGSSGHLTTVDINSEFIENARKNVSKFIDIENWEIINLDIKTCKFNELFDTIILDMPDPWNAIGNVKKNIKNGGFLITYSPNFNQAEKNVIEMKNNSFYIVETVEIMKRNIIVRENATRPDNNVIGHTAFITFSIKGNTI